MIAQNTTPIRSKKADVNEQSSPIEIVKWTLDRFAGQNMITTTAFGMEGCALIDMYAQAGAKLKVVYIDTLFFFPETYALRDRLVERYPSIEFIRKSVDLTAEQQTQLHGPELWKTNPDLCCKIRKVEPMAEVMRDVDVWITGVRRSQSATRAAVRVVDWDWKFQVVKVSPLASWDRAQVWQYVQDNRVPYNELHEQGYPTIGCTHCTKAVPGCKIGEYSRSGRWSGSEKTECGLHGGGI